MGGASVVAGRVMLGLSVVAVVAAGCTSPGKSEAVVAIEGAGGDLRGQAGRERAEEVRCCERRFPLNHRVRAACLSESAHHRGVCASPRCSSPDGGNTPDARAADSGAASDAVPPDARMPADASDAGAGLDAAPIDSGAGNDASDAGGPVACPTDVGISISEFIDFDSKLDRFGIGAQVSADETVTWSAAGTPGLTLIRPSASATGVECRVEGSLDVTATIIGPGSCVLTKTINIVCRPFCGNGIVGAGEQCDPPNGVTCDSKCQLGPAPTCGDGILEPGEACDSVSSTFCHLCQISLCGQCVQAYIRDPHVGLGDLCQSVPDAQKIGCLALEECMFRDAGHRCYVDGGSPSYPCFCADATCSTGPTGPCGRALQAYLGTTDQDALVAAANSAAMTQVIAAINGAYSCQHYCALNP